MRLLNKGGKGVWAGVFEVFRLVKELDPTLIRLNC